MPFYCFTTWQGTTVEKWIHVPTTIPEIVLTEGGWPAYRNFSAEWKGRRHYHGDLWPRWSDAAGINPDQIPEAMEADKKLGVSARYNELGQVELRDPKHEKEFCEAHGLYHMNSYGSRSDAQRMSADQWDTRFGERR